MNVSVKNELSSQFVFMNQQFIDGIFCFINYYKSII
jgi:hypothetical protein